VRGDFLREFAAGDVRDWSMNEQIGAVESVSEVLARVRGLAGAERRRVEKVFWAEGVRNFVQAFDAGWPIEKVVVSPVLLQSALADMLLRRLRKSGVRQVRVTPEEFRSVSQAERASGIGAIFRQRWTGLEHLDARRGLCLLAVEVIRSPGNLGTILRTAEACGAGGVIFLGEATDPFHPAVVRASMGGLLHLPLVRTSVARFGAWAAYHEAHVVGLSPEGRCLWTGMAEKRPTVLVLGEERGGLSKGLRGMCDQFVQLPMCGNADSLNVSVAAGVVMYELVRRRGGRAVQRSG
jgi:TrmH family RNA methyltransferase